MFVTPMRWFLGAAGAFTLAFNAFILWAVQFLPEGWEPQAIERTGMLWIATCSGASSLYQFRDRREGDWVLLLVTAVLSAAVIATVATALQPAGSVVDRNTLWGLLLASIASGILMLGTALWSKWPAKRMVAAT